MPENEYITYTSAPVVYDSLFMIHWGKKPILLLLLTCLGGMTSMAQRGKVFKQPAHVFPQSLGWWDSIYYYPQFGPGRITFFTGFTPAGDVQLNYNLYYGQMDMINAEGDTVSIKPLKTIKSVEVNDDLYYLDEKRGYLRVMISGDVTLVARTMLYLTEMAYVSGSIGQQAGEHYGTDVRGRPTVFDKTYILGSAFFFLDNNGKPIVANKTHLFRTFPEYRDRIEDFIRTESIEFQNEEDLKKVTAFCNSLRQLSPAGSGGLIVPALARASHTLRDSIYRFPEFLEGVVVYKDRVKAQHESLLNYNLLTGEMDMIENGDTVALRNSSTVASVNLDGAIYYNSSDGYIELIMAGPVSLGTLTNLIMVRSQSPTSPSKFTVDATPASAEMEVASFARMYARQNRYFLIDTKEHAFPASASSFYRFYPVFRKELDQYIAEKMPDFSKENDLKMMLTYLAGLKR